MWYLQGVCYAIIQTAELDLASVNNAPVVINDARLNEYDHEHILAVYSRACTARQVRAALSKQADPMEYFKTVLAPLSSGCSTPMLATAALMHLLRVYWAPLNNSQ
ncbi:hypothetical protein ACOBV8_18130 (plasmid) [Pseudoalteromonas espejiana]